MYTWNTFNIELLETPLTRRCQKLSLIPQLTNTSLLCNRSRLQVPSRYDRFYSQHASGIYADRYKSIFGLITKEEYFQTMFSWRAAGYTRFLFFSSDRKSSTSFFLGHCELLLRLCLLFHIKIVIASLSWSAHVLFPHWGRISGNLYHMFVSILLFPLKLLVDIFCRAFSPYVFHKRSLSVLQSFTDHPSQYCNFC